MKFSNIIFLIITIMSLNFQEAQAQENNWVKKFYDIQGEWNIETKNGHQFLVFKDNFKTLRGPDVKIYISPKKIEDIGKRDSVDKEGGVFIGVIKNFSGRQEYQLPEDIDLKDYKSIVLHCQEYSVVWGGTNLK